MSRELVFVKLGGSLITDKALPRSARVDVIERLAAEIATTRRSEPEVGLVIGHGSGSFGHPEAVSAGLADGLGPASDRSAVGAVQRAAWELHSLVVGALAAAGAAPFSFAPSSFLITRAGIPEAVFAAPLLAAIDGGFLPVVHGDIVLDAERSVAIASTETVLKAIIGRCGEADCAVAGVLWLGDTTGVLDDDGEPIPRITPSSWARLRPRVRGVAAHHDVTGGMRHRVDTALSLAVDGVPSLIADGGDADVIGRFVSTRRHPDTMPGTWVTDDD